MSILPGSAITEAPYLLTQAVFLLIGKTSALTMNIAGVIKDWLLIFFSYYLFGAPVTALNLLGYAFCCTGVRSCLLTTAFCVACVGEVRS